MSRSKKRKTDLQDECLQPKNRFQERDPFSDLTLVVEDQKLYVHKTLLMIHSPVFHKMLTDDFKERYMSEIPLPGKKYVAMVGLLEQIYPGDGAYLLKDEVLEDLLDLADEYDIQQVFTNCILHIGRKLYHKYNKQQDNIDWECKEMAMYRDRVLYYLGLVERYPRLRALRKKLLDQASHIPAQEMIQSKYFHLILTTATRNALLRKAKKKAETF